MSSETERRKSPIAFAALSLALVLLTAAFVALGFWQLERCVWKLDLIHQVDLRSHAEPEAAPGPEAWAALSLSQDAYRHVVVRGTFLNTLETQIHATTKEGYGYWVLTPLKTDEGFTVLINRGFVPTEKREPATRMEGQIEGEIEVVGLLRLTEPKGQFFAANNPANEQWYSRDVAAIAMRRGLTNTAPYFIDADSTPNQGGLPLGGLTVIAFPNNHLIYAITWFGLALLAGGFLVVNTRYYFRLKFQH